MFQRWVKRSSVALARRSLPSTSVTTISKKQVIPCPIPALCSSSPNFLDTPICWTRIGRSSKATPSERRPRSLPAPDCGVFSLGPSITEAIGYFTISSAAYRFGNGCSRLQNWPGLTARTRRLRNPETGLFPRQIRILISRGAKPVSQGVFSLQIP